MAIRYYNYASSKLTRIMAEFYALPQEEQTEETLSTLSVFRHLADAEYADLIDLYYGI